MKKPACILVSFLLFIQTGKSFGQKMTVKDSDSNVLMEVNDEGTVGSITVPPHTSAPTTTTNKLYNVDGSLYWNGSALGTAGSAGGWTDDGANVYTNSSTNKAGIGTSNPEFKLSLDRDGGILAKGKIDSGAVLSTSGIGTRLIWYPRKAAFRAGYVEHQWNDASVGYYSMATGSRTEASGFFSTALGYLTTASEYASLATGHQTRASGLYSTAMGLFTTANGLGATAMGQSSTASGDESTAMGMYSRAQSYVCLAVGQYNLGGGLPKTWIATDPLFEIGNGTDDVNRSNALTVLKNGNVGVGDNTPDYLLDMEPDASGGGYYDASDHQWHDGSSRKLKQDISPNQVDVLGILDDVNIVQYRFKTEVAENPEAPFHVGFIAEDTPELLTGKDRNSLSTGDCIGVLLAAVKEQQKTIGDQEKRIEALEAQISK